MTKKLFLLTFGMYLAPIAIVNLLGLGAVVLAYVEIAGRWLLIATMTYLIGIKLIQPRWWAYWAGLSCGVAIIGVSAMQIRGVGLVIWLVFLTTCVWLDQRRRSCRDRPS